ncbi:ras-related protein Rab-23-like [Watersipora subatra]|uniref:ras-related protein Rab-23-like n=1 Tax=Watersipora subatra TaxID=2589382 RepID=UPI00355BAB23
MEEDFEISLKVVIVGNGAVGKSSMIQRYCKGIFTKDYKKTIGVDFLEKELEFEGEEVRLMLWDTAGQEEFDAITRAYYRGAQACVLAFSITDRHSFEAIDSWKAKVEQEVGEIPMVLVQNKMDLAPDAVVTDEESESTAKRLKLRLYKTSVKDNMNIDAVFEYLTEKYISDSQAVMEEVAKPSSIGPGLPATLTQSNNSGAMVGFPTEFSKANQTELIQINSHEANGRSQHNSSHKLTKSSGSKRREKCLVI